MTTYYAIDSSFSCTLLVWYDDWLINSFSADNLYFFYGRHNIEDLLVTHARETKKSGWVFSTKELACHSNGVSFLVCAKCQSQAAGVPTSRDLPRFPHHKPTRKQFSGLLLLENTEDYKRSTLNNQTAHHQSHWITITTTNPTPNMFSETQGKSTFRRMSAEDDEMYQTPVTVSTFVDSSWSIRSHEMAVRSSLHVCFAMRLRFIQLSSLVFKMDYMVSISALTSTVFIHVWVWLIIVDNHDVESHDKICIPSIDLAIEDVDYICIDSVDKRSHASTTSLSLSLSIA